MFLQMPQKCDTWLPYSFSEFFAKTGAGTVSDESTQYTFPCHPRSSLQWARREAALLLLAHETEQGKKTEDGVIFISGQNKTIWT